MGRRVEIKGKITPPGNFKQLQKNLMTDGFVITFDGDNFTAVNKDCELSVETAKHKIKNYIDEVLLSLAILSNQPKLKVELQGVTEYGPIDGDNKKIVLHNSISIEASTYIVKEYDNKDIEEALSKKDLISKDDNLREAVKNYLEALEHRERNNALAISKLYKSIEYIQNTGESNKLGISREHLGKATKIMNDCKINESRHGREGPPERKIKPDELQYCFEITRKLIREYINYLEEKEHSSDNKNKNRGKKTMALVLF